MTETETQQSDVYAEFADEHPLDEGLIERLANQVVEIERERLDNTTISHSTTINKIDALIRKAVREEWKEANK